MSSKLCIQPSPGPTQVSGLRLSSRSTSISIWLSSSTATNPVAPPLCSISSSSLSSSSSSLSSSSSSLSEYCSSPPSPHSSSSLDSLLSRCTSLMISASPIIISSSSVQGRWCLSKLTATKCPLLSANLMARIYCLRPCPV